MATFNKRLELSFMPNDAGRRLHYCAFDTGRTETMCGTNAIYIVIEDVNVHDHIQLVLLSEQIIEQPGVSHSWYSTLKELSSQHSKPFYCRVTSTDRQTDRRRTNGRSPMTSEQRTWAGDLVRLKKILCLQQIHLLPHSARRFSEPCHTGHEIAKNSRTNLTYG